MPETDAHPNKRKPEPGYVGSHVRKIVEKEAVKRPLVFPLTAQDNRPIYDAEKKLVGIPERAQFFAACANLVNELANAGSSIDVLDMSLQAEKIMREMNP